MTHKIAVIGGDYIGPDVVAEGLKVMRAAGVDFTTTEFDLGARRYARDREVLSDETLESLRAHDAIFMGAIGGKPGEVPGGILERGIILRTRFAFDQYINLRPFLLVDKDIDFLVVRENTEGTYAGEGGFLRKGTPQEIATQGSVNTRMGVERCIRYAFELANGRDRKQLTLVHKTNVLAFAGDLWWRTFQEVAAEYPGVDTNYQHIDAACIHFVVNPQQYSVIVTDNLFGDILTDLGGAVSGGIGFAASANLNPDRTTPSMFEPVHGSAPDIAGQNVANPMAAILSVAMMLDFLGEDDAANRIRAACEDAPDGSTTEIGDAVAARLA